MRQSRIPHAVYPGTLWIWLLAGLGLIVACSPPSTSEVDVPDELLELETIAEMDASAAQERERLESELASAQARLEQRDDWVREQEALLEERRSLVAQQESLASRLVELERREQALSIRDADLEVRERRLEAAEAATNGDSRREAREPAPAEVSAMEGSTEGPSETRWVEASLAAGTIVDIELLQTVTSRSAQPGDRFATRVARDVYSEDGLLVVPAGSEMHGTVTAAKRLKRVGGQSRLGVEMDSLVLPSGQTVGVRASLYEVGTNQKNDKKKIAVAAAAGAVLGRILGSKGGGSSTALGAALGAAAGTAVVASRKGQDVELAEGDIIAVRLDEVVTVETELVGVAEATAGSR